MRRILPAMFFALLAVLFSEPSRLQAQSGPFVGLIVSQDGCPATIEPFCQRADGTVRVGDRLRFNVVYSASSPPGDPDPERFRQVRFTFGGDLGNVVGTTAEDRCMFVFGFFSPTASFTTIFTTPGQKTITVTALRCFGDTPSPEVFAVGEATIDVCPVNGCAPQRQFEIVPAALNFPGNPLPAIGVPEGGGSLGTPFNLKLGQQISFEYISVDAQTGVTTAVPATFTFKEKQQPASLGNLSEIFSNPTRLFPDNVLIHFTDAVPDQFFAVHSGEAVISITPTDPSSGAPPVKLTVKVPSCMLGESCGVRLGTTHNEYDDDIVRFADFRGIPPQILKDQIQRETGFDENAYRYEPLTVDFLQVSTQVEAPGVPGDLREDPALIPWRVQTSADDVDSPGLSQGVNLNDPNSPELALRERFLVSVTTADLPFAGLIKFVGPLQSPPRPITANDPPIEMENILLTNLRQNWICNAAKTSCTPQYQRYRDFRATHRPFTAQTSLAASYGLMQVLYTVAVLERGYTDGDGIGLQPTGLWRRKTSIDLGTEHLASLFRNWKNFSSVADSPQINALDDFTKKIGIALALYNGVSKPRRIILNENSLTEYATDVLARSKNFLPQ